MGRAQNARRPSVAHRRCGHLGESRLSSRSCCGVTVRSVGHSVPFRPGCQGCLCLSFGTYLKPRSRSVLDRLDAVKRGRYQTDQRLNAPAWHSVGRLSRRPAERPPVGSIAEADPIAGRSGGQRIGRGRAERQLPSRGARGSLLNGAATISRQSISPDRVRKCSRQELHPNLRGPPRPGRPRPGGPAPGTASRPGGGGRPGR